MITKNEIINSLKSINKTYFQINDLDEYANKILKFGKNILKRNDKNQIISFVLYYDNGPAIFISMVWTDPAYEGKGLAKKLLSDLIEHSKKDITLEVHVNNSAKFLYKNLNFIEESQNNDNILMRYHRSERANIFIK